MGADVSVFEEGELEQSFWKYHGKVSARSVIYPS